MQPWNTCAELLRLFGVEPKSSKWARYFCEIAEYAAILRHFDGMDQLAAVERLYMRQLRISPVVLWSNLRRAVLPLMDAGGATLRALGLDVPDVYSCHVLLAAIAVVQEGAVSPLDVEVYRQIKDVLP